MARFLTDTEQRTLVAAADRLVPPLDDHPGAAALGVAEYVDTLLAAFSFDPPRIHAGGPFSGRHGGEASFGDFLPLSRLEELASRWDTSKRIADLLVRSGEASESLQKLERAVADTPTDAQARLALADARYASGQGNALTEGIVEALRSGADPAPLREAVELVEGRTALEAFRLDTRKVLAEFDASRVKLPGGAARVLAPTPPT